MKPCYPFHILFIYFFTYIFTHFNARFIGRNFTYFSHASSHKSLYTILLMADLISQEFHLFFLCRFIHSGKFSNQYEQISHTFHMPLTCTVSNISHGYVSTYACIYIKKHSLLNMHIYLESQFHIKSTTLKGRCLSNRPQVSVVYS